MDYLPKDPAILVSSIVDIVNRSALPLGSSKNFKKDNYMLKDKT